MAGGHRIGVDIGGTFTDVVLVGPDGTLRAKKVLSTPDDYARGVVDGILELLHDNAVAPDGVTKVVHASTVASNAVLEGKGSSCCLLTTAGFRDVLEMRRLRIPVMYELQYEKPRPLVPRRLRFEIPERTGPRGEEWAALDEGAVRAAAERARAEGVAAVAISFLHAYANPAHERRAAEIVREVVGDGRLHHLLLRHPRRDPRVRAHEHGGRQRVRRPRRRALPSLARVAAWPPSGSRLRSRSCSPAAA